MILDYLEQKRMTYFFKGPLCQHKFYYYHYTGALVQCSDLDATNTILKCFLKTKSLNSSVDNSTLRFANTKHFDFININNFAKFQ